MGRFRQRNISLLFSVLAILYSLSSAGIVKRAATCTGNCAEQANNGLDNAEIPAGAPGTSNNNGNENGNCVGNCIGNESGNRNGNRNINSSNNGNSNGNCHGNCFFNKDGNDNGNDNVNVDDNGNKNGNCRGNCFFRNNGNNNGNGNGDPVRDSAGRDAVMGFIEETIDNQGNDQENCNGNCYEPQPMGRTENYQADFDIERSPFTCTSGEGYRYHVIPETHCLEIYRRRDDGNRGSRSRFSQYACPAGTVLDIDTCGCNHWYLTSIFKNCRSYNDEFKG